MFSPHLVHIHSENEFCFQYMCQSKTSGRTNNLRVAKPRGTFPFLELPPTAQKHPDKPGFRAGTI